MLKVLAFLLALFFCGLLTWLMLPRVWNENPISQTELSIEQFSASKMYQVWPGPSKEDRIRARVVLRGEALVFEDGPTDLIMNMHSMRKAVLSLVYGIAVDQGLVDLNKTLRDLKIDEVVPLTSQEKTATIRDLLMFRSGVYLPAAGEHDEQITDRPIRDSYKPGEYFFANNFDANALHTIFVQETGYELGAFMEEFLAVPLGMQDFTARNVVIGDPWFWPSQDTLHEQYIMYMSARDSARVGALVAQKGRWNGVQVVSKAWIDLITAPHSDLSKSKIAYHHYDAAGYQWMLDSQSGTIWTDGYGEHFLMVDANANITIVERNYTGNSLFSILQWMLSRNKFSQSRSGILRARDAVIGE